MLPLVQHGRRHKQHDLDLQDLLQLNERLCRKERKSCRYAGPQYEQAGKNERRRKLQLHTVARREQRCQRDQTDDNGHRRVVHEPERQFVRIHHTDPGPQQYADECVTKGVRQHRGDEACQDYVTYRHIDESPIQFARCRIAACAGIQSGRPPAHRPQASPVRIARNSTAVAGDIYAAAFSPTRFRSATTSPAHAASGKGSLSNGRCPGAQPM